MSLKLVARPDEAVNPAAAMSETVALSERHVEFLERISRGMNPDMPAAFGWPHAIRAILDHFEENGIDFTAASSEDEIAAVAAARLREATGPLYASAPLRSGARPECRSNPPATDRRHSEKPPRSDRG
jgi:hypothetical protein